MEMRTSFKFTIDGAESGEFMFEGWPDAVEAFMKYCNNNGFKIDEKHLRQVAEVAKLRRVTL